MHGHVVGYMGLVTTVSGIILGTFIVFTVRMINISTTQDEQGDFSSRPLLNMILAL